MSRAQVGEWGAPEHRGSRIDLRFSLDMMRGHFPSYITGQTHLYPPDGGRPPRLNYRSEAHVPAAFGVTRRIWPLVYRSPQRRPIFGRREETFKSPELAGQLRDRFDQRPLNASTTENCLTRSSVPPQPRLATVGAGRSRGDQLAGPWAVATMRWKNLFRPQMPLSRKKRPEC